MKRQRGQEGQEETRGLGRLTFHYNREERLGLTSAALNKHRDEGSFFRKYRGPLIILLDLAILAGMYGLYSWLAGGRSRSTIPGYSVVLDAAQFGDQALARLVFTQTKAAPALSGSIFEVRFAVTGTDLVATRKDVLPTGLHQTRTIRAVLEPLPRRVTSNRKPPKVTATITVASTTIHMTIQMKQE